MIIQPDLIPQWEVLDSTCTCTSVDFCSRCWVLHQVASAPTVQGKKSKNLWYETPKYSPYSGVRVSVPYLHVYKESETHIPGVGGAEQAVGTKSEKGIRKTEVTQISCKTWRKYFLFCRFVFFFLLNCEVTFFTVGKRETEKRCIFSQYLSRHEREKEEQWCPRVSKFL